MNKFEFVNDLQDCDIVLRRDPLTKMWVTRAHIVVLENENPENIYAWGCVGVSPLVAESVRDFIRQCNARHKRMKSEKEASDALAQANAIRQRGFGGKKVNG